MVQKYFKIEQNRQVFMQKHLSKRINIYLSLKICTFTMLNKNLNKKLGWIFRTMQNYLPISNFSFICLAYKNIL